MGHDPITASEMLSAETHPGDSQKVELLGRNRLIDDLLRADLEVALPVRDRGIDLIAYADLSTAVTRYIARPIQMKAAWGRSFGIDRRYEKFPDLILAFVWHLGERDRAVTFAMSYPVALEIGDAMGWTSTESWAVGGAYTTSRPSGRLSKLLEAHQMDSARWWTLMTNV